MRHFNLIIVIATFIAGGFFASCNQPGKTDHKEKASTEKVPEPDKNSVKPNTDGPTTNIQDHDNSGAGELDFLIELNGKYPYEVKLLDNPALKKRLTNLLGARFTFLKDTWAVENPIEVKNNIFVATGCEAHNCGSTNFIIVVDLAKNVLYAGVREEEKVKTYSENGSSIQQVNEWAAGN